MNEAFAAQAFGFIEARLERGRECAALGDVEHVSVGCVGHATLIIPPPSPQAWCAAVPAAVPEFAEPFAARRSPNDTSPWSLPRPRLCASSRPGGGSPLG